MLTRSRSKSLEVDSESSSSQPQSQASSFGDSAPLEEYVPKKRGRSTNRKCSTHVAQWIFILSDKQQKQNSLFIPLKDPKTGCMRKYLVGRLTEPDESTNRNVLCEVMKVSDGPRSWFIDDSMQTDGSLFMCTPIDPLFLALPYLLAAGRLGKFTTLDTILEDESTHGIHVLEECVNSDQWEHIADVKVLSSGRKVYKYSWERTQVWLRAKVDALGAGLKSEGVYVGVGSVSSSLVRSNKHINVQADDYLKYACGIISDYLPKEVAEKLALDYASPIESRGKSMRESESIGHSEAPPAKKGRLVNNGEPFEDYTQLSTKTQKQAIPLTQSQRALAKVVKTGMKSISSFFSLKRDKID